MKTIVDCSGVYEILNTTNGKRYIGSAAISFKQRWKDHRIKLRNKKHHNKILQRAWDRDGESAFLFAIIVVCQPPDCVMYEQRFIDLFDSTNRSNGYNLSPTAGSVLGMRLSPDAIAKISAFHRQRYSNNPSARAVQAVNATGRVFSTETRAKISKARSEYYQQHPEAKLAARLRTLSHSADPVIKKKRSASQKRFYQLNPTAASDNSDRQKLMWSDPVYRAARLKQFRATRAATIAKKASTQ